MRYLYVDFKIGQDAPAGASGPTGSKGTQGDAGPAGPTGSSGPKGFVGDLGPTGPKGIQGIQGSTGPQGPLGDTGPTGPTGTKGALGPSGTAGPTGTQGPKGTAGASGDAGATGPTGIKGIDGAAGATGPAGPQGTKGDVGPTGTGGTAGDAGATGPTGPTGPDGPSGPQGQKGQKGAAGTTLTVTFSSTYLEGGAIIVETLENHAVSAPITANASGLPVSSYNWSKTGLGSTLSSSTSQTASLGYPGQADGTNKTGTVTCLVTFSGGYTKSQTANWDFSWFASGSPDYCVSIDMIMSNGRTAAQAVVGDRHPTRVPHDDDRTGSYLVFEDIAIDYVGTPVAEPCTKIVTSSGAWLVCSNSTPFDLKTSKKNMEPGHWKFATDMLGEYVLVEHNSMGARWEQVVDLIDVGLHLVVPISFGGRSFAAGGEERHLIYSHNMAKQV